MAARLVVWHPGEEVSSAPQPQQQPHASSHAALKREAPRLGRAAPADALQTKNPGPAEIPDPTYYAARELDVYPSLENVMEPQYAASDSAGVKGHVLLLVLIDAQGGIDELNVVEAVPPGHFEDDARRAFQSVRFKPALKNGRAVKSRVLVRIEYGPAESGAR